MRYRVVKISQQWEGYGRQAPSIERVIVPDAGDKADALVLAEVACSEHAETIMVKYYASGTLSGEHTGFTLVTNNGTVVWYAIKPN